MRTHSAAATLTLALLASCTNTSGDDTTGTPDGGGGNEGSTNTDGGKITGCPVPVNGEMVDDMEMGTGSIRTSKGRTGAWYTYNDASPGGVQAPLAMTPFLPAMLTPARDKGDGTTSTMAARTNGMGFSTWGAGMGFDWNNAGAGDAGGNGVANPYDGSAYNAIVFCGKIGGGVGTVKVNFHNKDTDKSGGVCDSASNKCDDDFGASVTLGSDWKPFTLKFSELAQEGWGTPVAGGFKPATLLSLHFQVGKNATFDYYVDDIYLITK